MRAKTADRGDLQLRGPHARYPALKAQRQFPGLVVADNETRPDQHDFPLRAPIIAHMGGIPQDFDALQQGIQQWCLASLPRDHKPLPP